MAKPAVTAWVPGGFHLYFLSAGLVSGVLIQTPFLLLVTAAMLAAAAWMHWKGRPAMPAAALGGGAPDA